MLAAKTFLLDLTSLQDHHKGASVILMISMPFWVLKRRGEASSLPLLILEHGQVLAIYTIYPHQGPFSLGNNGR